MERAFDLYRKSLERNRGPVKRAKEVRVGSEVVAKVKKVSLKRSCPQHGGLMFLWACLWMLREIEVRSMKVRDILWSDEGKWAAIKLPISKNGQVGAGVRRTLKCRGRDNCIDVCPLKVAKAVVAPAKNKSNTLGMPLLTDSKSLFVTKRGVVNSWKALFGATVLGHSARRSGAM